MTSFLVVGPDFSTSNEFILGAGPMTKYSRRLHADPWRHHEFCPRDVGSAVANEILSRVGFGDQTEINKVSFSFSIDFRLLVLEDIFSKW